MNTEIFDDLLLHYKKEYGQIEAMELYKWKAVAHFKDKWNIDADDFYKMLKEALQKTSNLMDTGNYYPHRSILLAAEKEPETVREMFRSLFDSQNTSLKEKLCCFREAADGIVERHKEPRFTKSYQDDRAIMLYLNLKYPEKYYLYKYTMFKDLNDLIDYTEMAPAGSIEVIYQFESLCEMIRKRVLSDQELLELYEPRRAAYYDPEYHLLVQDIIYSVIYYTQPELLKATKKTVLVKRFELEAKKKKALLKAIQTDYEVQAKRQKCIGDAGEEFVYQYERAQVAKYKLPKNRQVRWVSKWDGDGAGYDILSYDKDGSEKYIEVKATTGEESSSFFVTANELEMSEQHPENYYLYRVYELDTTIPHGKLAIHKGSLRNFCITPQTYKVDFK